MSVSGRLLLVTTVSIWHVAEVYSLRFAATKLTSSNGNKWDDSAQYLMSVSPIKTDS